MTPPVWETVLNGGLEQLGIVERDSVDRLVAYVGELERWSERLGLVHASGKELIVRHILDSLAGLSTVRTLIDGHDAPTIADIGTGGGLPGIPLACFLPHCMVHLVERSERKCGFLRGALLTARTRNAQVVNEDLSALREQYQVVVFRAFQPLSAPLVSRMMRLLRPGGAVCAYKGRAERIRAEIASLGDDLAARVHTETVRVTAPFLEEERHLVIVRARSNETAMPVGES